MAFSYLNVFVQIILIWAILLCFTASITLNHPNTAESAFSDTGIVTEQRQGLRQTVEKLAEQYGFPTDIVMAELSEARLSALNRRAAQYWLDGINGAAELTAPKLNIELQARLLSDVNFSSQHGAQAQEVADQVSSEIVSAAEASAYPINDGLAQVAFRQIAPYRVGRMVRLAAIAGCVLCALLLLAVIGINRRHMIRVGWYEGAALVCGGLLTLVTRMLLSVLPVMKLPADTRLLRQIALLLGVVSQTLALTSILVVALGACFMVLYAMWIYRCNHYSHNELFGRY